MFSMARINTFRVVFILVGMIYGVYAARLPGLKLQAELDDAAVGYMLLVFGVGSICGFVAIGKILKVWSTAKFLRILQWTTPLVLIAMGFAYNQIAITVLAAVMGFLIGSYDVLMNVQAILLEKATKKRHLSSMHAYYSFGGFAGAGFGALCAWWDFTPWLTFVAFAVVGYGLVAWVGQDFLPDEKQETDSGNEKKQTAKVPMFTYLCGVFALCAYISEGSAGEWGSIFLVSEKGADQATAALSFSVFAVTMACCRLFGDKLRQMYGDLFVFAAGSVLALFAMSTVLYADHPWVCLAGYALLGAGLFPIVPIAMSRASDGGVPAAKASTIVAFMGYTGLLVIPPVLGNISKVWGLSTAFLIPLACCAILVVGSAALRKKKLTD